MFMNLILVLTQFQSSFDSYPILIKFQWPQTGPNPEQPTNPSNCTTLLATIAIKMTSFSSTCIVASRSLNYWLLNEVGDTYKSSITKLAKRLKYHNEIFVNKQLNLWRNKDDFTCWLQKELKIMFKIHLLKLLYINLNELMRIYVL